MSYPSDLAKVSTSDPNFFRRLYRVFATENELETLSYRLDLTEIQESCSVRNALLSRKLATLLINDLGQLDEEKLAATLVEFKKTLYSIGPGREHDGRRQEQILHVLKCLSQDKSLKQALLQISKPYNHLVAEQVIRDTLALPPKTPIGDAETRRAALSAWFCFLRQNVGSCFATAPAILVHNEQPKQFLKDLAEMLGTGRIKRTFGGVEYAVPLSTTSGNGDLKKPFLLQKTETGFEPPIWQAPGLVTALQAAGVLKATVLKEQVKEIRDTFNEMIQEPQVVTNADSLLRRFIGKFKSGDAFSKAFHLAQEAFKGLAENTLLKTWEYTIASFAETKADFTRWNLYSSLGFLREDRGGIGEKVYELLKGKLDELNRKVQDYQFEYEQLFTVIKGLESRMKAISSEQEGKWLNLEYQMKVNEFRSVEELRDKTHYQAQGIAKLYEVMLEEYYRLFQDYFQEIYDADMQDVEENPFDDTPAGFRLLYKHGRANTAVWTKIYSPKEYIDALVSFFTATENEFTTNPEFKGMEGIVSEVVTTIISHVRTEEFLETAFYRMAKAHNIQPIKDPLNHLDQIAKKPWVYTSGGAITTLVSCYFKTEGKLTEKERWVENPMELLTFLVDQIKEMPPKRLDDFLQEGRGSFLMHSPTHAFLFKPRYEPFFSATKKDAYTYIDLRDRFLTEMNHFLYQQILDPYELRALIDLLKKMVPQSQSDALSQVAPLFYGKMSPQEFRQEILREVSIREEIVDHLLYQSLPLTRGDLVKDRLLQVIEALKWPFEGIEGAVDDIQKSFNRFDILPASQMFDLVRALVLFLTKRTQFSFNIQAHLLDTMRKLNLAFPKPIFFADTNWVKDLFAFVVNPGTGEVELWRVDEIGLTGYPLPDWKKWLDGSHKSPTWGVFLNHYEYTTVSFGDSLMGK